MVLADVTDGHLSPLLTCLLTLRFAKARIVLWLFGPIRVVQYHVYVALGWVGGKRYLEREM